VKCSAEGPRDNGSRVEARLRAIVEGCGVPQCEREEYLAFARAFHRSLRRPPVPDYSKHTKRAVQRFFERGLKGRTLVAIGRAVEAWMFRRGDTS
jgi:hypothetical protein